MNINRLRFCQLVFICLVLQACKLTLVAETGGSIISTSGLNNCSDQCVLEISDTNFSDTFSAVPDAGFRFAGWEKAPLSLCGDTLTPCVLATRILEISASLSTILTSDLNFFLKARFEPASSNVLNDVNDWLYFIDVNLEQDVVDQIADSTHDMVVIDFITSEANNTDYPLASVINRWQQADHPKLVLAYIDIGQAESYRTYWQEDWRVGSPAWIVGDDPDGWVENYPVAYWYDDWQNLWLDTDGYLQGISDAGFDGVYLDWIEAYSDTSVAAKAMTDGVDARQEMISFVGKIRNFGRAQNENFVVIGQNAAELAEYDEYLNNIDAIAQEQVWFDGAADNDPPGDCPLPSTDADIDTDAYYDSLSVGCQRQFNEYPESTLHVSSEEYLSFLTPAQNKGTLIFSVDYALESDNISWVEKTSRALGFVPFIGSRALNQYVAPR